MFAAKEGRRSGSLALWFGGGSGRWSLALGFRVRCLRLVGAGLGSVVVPWFDAAAFRTVLGHFCSGITIVTALAGDEPVGLTCQSFASVSLDPPLVLFVPAKESNSWPRIRSAGHFCANVLSEAQEQLGRRFAIRGADKFEGVGWRPGLDGAPILDGCLAYIECEIEAVHDAGDHDIVVGRVVDLAVGAEGNPLLFYRGGYGRFAV